jgi:hypothetical protein
MTSNFPKSASKITHTEHSFIKHTMYDLHVKLSRCLLWMNQNCKGICKFPHSASKITYTESSYNTSKPITQQRHLFAGNVHCKSQIITIILNIKNKSAFYIIMFSYIIGITFHINYELDPNSIHRRLHIKYQSSQNTPIIFKANLLSIFSCFHLKLFLRFPVVDWFCVFYTYEFWLSLWKIVRSSVILLLPLFIL